MLVHVFVSELPDMVEIERSVAVEGETPTCSFIMFGFKVICWALLFHLKVNESR